MTRAKYLFSATTMGVLVGGLLVALSGRTGTEATVEFTLCVGIFALCGVFARTNWCDVAVDFFSRTLHRWW